LRAHHRRHHLREEKLSVFAASSSIGISIPLDAGYHCVRCHAIDIAQSARFERNHHHGRYDGEGAEGYKRFDKGSAVVGVEERAAS